MPPNCKVGPLGAGMETRTLVPQGSNVAASTSAKEALFVRVRVAVKTGHSDPNLEPCTASPQSVYALA